MSVYWSVDNDGYAAPAISVASGHAIAAAVSAATSTTTTAVAAAIGN